MDTPVTNTDGSTAGASPALTILVTSRQRRGAEVFGERLAVGLPDHGWDVDFISLAAGPDEARASVSAKALSDTPPGGLGRLDLPVVRALRRRLQDHGTEVLLANGSSTLQYGVAAARTIWSRPRIAYGSIGEPEYWAASPRQRALYQLLLRAVDRVFSVSEATGRQLIETFGVPASKLRVLHTGVPRTLLDVSPLPREDELHLLFMGSLSVEKDPLAAVEVLRRVRENTAARLRFVGGGPLSDDIEAAAAAAGMADSVELAGPVDDVGPHLSWADVLVLTSKTEGLPAAPLEAAAASVPTVAFDVGGVSETMLEGVSGELVPAGDVAAAAEAVLRLAEDEDQRQAAGAQARGLILNDFTVEDAVARYDDALRELLKGAR